MTLRNGTTIEAETYDDALRQLGLEELFEEVTNMSFTNFDSNERDVLPMELVEKTLDKASDEYLLLFPQTGSDPRYRIIHLHSPVTNQGDNDGS